MSINDDGVNYRIRPAKSIIRKMIVDSLKNLVHFDRMKNYQYVGFGSYTFTDFSLFHRSLGIEKMVSIERELDTEERCKFNKPYKCIKLIMGHSNGIFPTINWKPKTIAWLDYTDKLTEEVFKDIHTFCTKAPSGSVIIVTVNAHPEKIADRLDIMKRNIGSRFPDGLKATDLAKHKTAMFCRTKIQEEIISELGARNALLPDEEKLQYKQLFNFYYSDSSPMLTTGGIVFSNRDAPKFKQSGFYKLEFISKDEQMQHQIMVPVLTISEIQGLNSYMPRKKLSRCRIPITLSERTEYIKIYRYFPTFAEMDVN